MSALVLRCCGPHGESYGSFRWPLAVGAEVVAPDWSARAECGNGLHGWLYGAGDINVANIVDDGAWLVVEVDSSSLVMLGGKCKFPRGTVRFVGSMREAAAYLIEHEPRAKTCAVIGATLSGGRREVVQVGALGTATAGALGTATAGDSGTIVIEWLDRKAGRYRRTVGYVGEQGVKPNTAYRCDANGKLVRAETAP